MSCNRRHLLFGRLRRSALGSHRASLDDVGLSSIYFGPNLVNAFLWSKHGRQCRRLDIGNNYFVRWIRLSRRIVVILHGGIDGSETPRLGFHLGFHGRAEFFVTIPTLVVVLLLLLLPIGEVTLSIGHKV